MLTAQAQTLSLDSCRAMALRNNKQLGIARAKQQAAMNVRKSARTKYLPHIDVAGGWMLSSREVSLLNNDQKNTLSTLGTNAIGSVDVSHVSNLLTSMVQKGVLSPAEAQQYGQLLSGTTQQLAAYGDALGEKLQDAFRTDTRSIIVGSIVVNQEDGWLTFDDCIGYFYDGMEANVEDTKLTLAHLNDSKLMVYLVTSSPKIKMHLKSLDNTSITREVNFEPLLNGRTTSKYGFCVVISRKDKTTQSGFNYVYFSVIDYERDAKLCEGYWDGTALTQHRSEVNERYTIYSLEFDRLTLYRIKFYTKYEDFTEEVIPSIPDEKTMYEVAHIAIRSVANTDVLNDITDQLQDNELIWNKKSGTLHIKSEGKIYRIGSNSAPDDDNNNNDTMTDKQLIETLEKMGIIVNGVVYEKDENGDDVVKSFNSISMNPIADITFIHQDTGNKYRYSVDAEGNLTGKYAGNENVEDNTIADLLEKHGNPNGYDQQDYQAVRGFISDYLFRRKGYYAMNDEVGVNCTGDAYENSDRLRISAFYAPISTDTAHGCTHSFIELENTSDVDIPLEGVYLHFFDASENTYAMVDNVLTLTSDIVHHLPLDGVIKAGGTYLIRGAKHAEFDDESAFIKVKTFDKEWYENGQLLSFEQKPVKLNGANVDDNSPAKAAYRFCLTYGLPELSAHEKLVESAEDI